jgi:hypothetical protein
MEVSMQKNFPSIKTLMMIDQGRTTEEAATLARTILTACKREELEALPIYEKYYQKIGIHMHNPHSLNELKMQMCNIALDLYGVEAFETLHNGWCEYVNVGDPYIATIVLFGGRFFVGGYGDTQERYGAKE